MLMGNLVADWNKQTLASGNVVASNSIAVNETRLDKNGEKVEQVMFMDITAWSKLAETLTQHTSKGSALFVEGKIKQEQWQDKETGATKTKHAVTIINAQFIGAKAQNGAPSASQPQSQQSMPRASHLPPAEPQRQAPAGAITHDDEIPF